MINDGYVYVKGHGVVRSASSASTYLTAAAHGGPWGNWIRRGLDAYLTHQNDRAVLCYIHAGELGYEVGASNAAFVVQKRMVQDRRERLFGLIRGDVRAFLRVYYSGSSDTDADTPHLTQMLIKNYNYHSSVYMRQLVLSASYGNKESYVRMGHAYMDGARKLQMFHSETREAYGMLPGSNPVAALYYYKQASRLSHPLADVYVGLLYQYYPPDIYSLISSQSTLPGYSSVLLDNMRLAHQYYQAALDNPVLPPSFHYIVQGFATLSSAMLSLHQRQPSFVTVQLIQSNTTTEYRLKYQYDSYWDYVTNSIHQLMQWLYIYYCKYL